MDTRERQALSMQLDSCCSIDHLELLLIAPGLQVAEHRLPKAFDYHRVPAPFIQVCSSEYPLISVARPTAGMM